MKGDHLNSTPEYRYATGTLNVKYLKPTPNTEVELRARVVEVKGRKTVLSCDFYSENGEKTAEAEVVAIRVFDSSEDKETVFKKLNLAYASRVIFYWKLHRSLVRLHDYDRGIARFFLHVPFGEKGPWHRARKNSKSCHTNHIECFYRW